MRRPGHTRLRLVIAVLNNCWRGRDDDEMVASGALDLSAGKLGVALDVLIAMRAGEFEFAHETRWLCEEFWQIDTPKRSSFQSKMLRKSCKD